MASKQSSPTYIIVHEHGFDIRIKVVPGAKTERVVGELGNRLKVQLQAPPEGGKANKALIKLLATWLNCKNNNLELINGHTSPLKTIRASTHVTPPQ